MLEEASVIINPVSSPVTYHKIGWNEKPTIINLVDAISPLLIKGNKEKSLSVMYLSYTDQEPKPSTETNGLLLLTPENVHLICKNKITLNEYMGLNGISVLKKNINKQLILMPFPQLLFLSDLLKENHPFINKLL